MSCNLCNTRPPRRHCPALSAEICGRCCGEERERTIECPFDCGHLLEARERETMYDLPDDYPHQDLDTSERYLRTQEPLLLTTAAMIFFAAAKVKAMDLDVREGVAALINERRGLPVGSLGEPAAALREEFEQRFATFRTAALAEGAAFTEHDVLRILAFFQREEMHTNNRRPKSRAYVDWLRSWVSQMAAGMPE